MISPMAGLLRQCSPGAEHTSLRTGVRKSGRTHYHRIGKERPAQSHDVEAMLPLEKGVMFGERAHASGLAGVSYSAASENMDP
jgi:hypothetical protein